MKRQQTVTLFRSRLLEVIHRGGLSRSAFAEKVGMDRSTLSQLLSVDNDRLPRVETLASIAQAEQVSIDWLVGLSQEGSLGANILKQSVQVEPDAPSPADERLARWHTEAAGYKIRYVPTTLPDLLKTDRVNEYEYGQFETIDAEKSLERSQAKLALHRESGSDIEVCSSIQAVQGLALGEGVWRDLEVRAREEQLERMIALGEELYPAVRWFLYDLRHRFSVPLTIFGPKRAVVYVGQMYFVFNSLEHIRHLTRHFDDLIRAAILQPPAVLDLLRSLLADLRGRRP